MSSGWAVETIDLTRKFDRKTAVNHLNLQVAEGEFFGFLGPNGAGKSTTINMLVGLLRPTGGTALITGIDMWKDPLAAKSKIGVLPEGMQLYQRLSAREFIQFFFVRNPGFERWFGPFETCRRWSAAVVRRKESWLL